jgi:hypothetical protein
MKDVCTLMTCFLRSLSTVEFKQKFVVTFIYNLYDLCVLLYVMTMSCMFKSLVKLLFCSVPKIHGRFPKFNGLFTHIDFKDIVMVLTLHLFPGSVHIL